MCLACLRACPLSTHVMAVRCCLVTYNVVQQSSDSGSSAAMLSASLCRKKALPLAVSLSVLNSISMRPAGTKYGHACRLFAGYPLRDNGSESLSMRLLALHGMCACPDCLLW